ncbi:MAG: diaminopimelate epimerase [Rhodospirillaceae bacterium]
MVACETVADLDFQGCAPYKPAMEQSSIPFRKMHGLGNDFVVVDLRTESFRPEAAWVRAVAARRTGVGCDQFITIESPPDTDQNGAVAAMGIMNADGSTVEACGNAARCVGALLLSETGQDSVLVDTPAGPISMRRAEDGDQVSVDMGPAILGWEQIPLAEDLDSLHLPISSGPLSDPVGVSMGNPHMIFFVPDAEAIDLEDLGPGLEHHPLFPNRTNVEVVSLRPDGSLRMRVWERGVGITRACGTGACAVLVAAARRGLTGPSALVHLDGGPLHILWRQEDDGHVIMTGPASESYVGSISRTFGATA